MRDRYRSLIAPLQVPECRSLFGAQAISGVGDWAGRLALAAVVFDRSDSAGWAAAVTVAALLPWIGPGQFLATFADRFGRISVMITADLVRAAVFLLVLIPQPTWTLLVWAFVAGLCVPPFAGSRSSALVELTPPDRYPSALALYGVMTQAEVMLGYALGGLVIAAVGPTAALGANAVSFVISASILSGLRDTSAARRNTTQQTGLAGMRAGARIWRSDTLCRRALALYVGISMFMILPEALVVPFADQIELPSQGVGILAALVAVGSIIGVVTAPTVGSHHALLRIAAARAAVLAGITGVLFATGTHPAIAGAAYLFSGAVDAVSVPTNQVVGERLPTAGRAAAMSVAGGVQYAAQIVAIAAAGVVATLESPRVALLIGMCLAVTVSAWAVLAPVRERGAEAIAIEQPT